MALFRRKRRSKDDRERFLKGKKTRTTIEARALEIAAAKGLAALTIGGLAEELKMSKSGLFAHFRSKEALELAIVELARTVFANHILVPAERGHPGLEKLWNLCDFWLEHIEDHVFGGAYFFAGAFFERARQSGPVARQIKTAARDWVEALERAVREAQKRKEIDRDPYADETAFELNGLLQGAYWAHLMGQRGALDWAREKVLERLEALATDEVPSKAFSSVRAFRRHLRRKLV